MAAPPAAARAASACAAAACAAAACAFAVCAAAISCERGCSALKGFVSAVGASAPFRHASLSACACVSSLSTSSASMRTETPALAQRSGCTCSVARLYARLIALSLRSSGSHGRMPPSSASAGPEKMRGHCSSSSRSSTTKPFPLRCSKRRRSKLSVVSAYLRQAQTVCLVCK
eukprot:6208702-Pleurochrysis_carterae.AAC.3